MNGIPAVATVCQGGPMPRRSRRLAVLATALVVLAGCQAPDDPRPTTTFTTLADSCNHPPDTGGGDGGLGAGFDYTDEHHDFGEAAPMSLCMYLSKGSVHVTGSAAHIAVTPETFPTPGTRYDFTVTVSSGPPGGLAFELVGDQGRVGGHFNGPAIQTDDTGWYFGAEHEPTD